MQLSLGRWKQPAGVGCVVTSQQLQSTALWIGPFCCQLSSVRIQCGAHPSLSLLAFCYRPSWIWVTMTFTSCNNAQICENWTDSTQHIKLARTLEASKNKSDGRHEWKNSLGCFYILYLSRWLNGNWTEWGRVFLNHTELPPSVWALLRTLEGQNWVKLSLQWKEMAAALRVLQVYTETQNCTWHADCGINKN